MWHLRRCQWLTTSTVGTGKSFRSMAVLPHRKKRPQQAPATLLRAMLIFTLCPHLHRSAHLLCQGARLNPKGLCHQCVTYPCFFHLFRDICFILLKGKGEEKQKDHSHRLLWKQGQFLSITPLGVSNMGNENWKRCHCCHFQQLSQAGDFEISPW